MLTAVETEAPDVAKSDEQDRGKIPEATVVSLL